MATPANRVPVRIARGTKANLDAAISELGEGELCFASDEDQGYIVKNGSLVVFAGAGSGSTLASLEDVDTTGATEDSALIYNGTTWVPGTPSGSFGRGDGGDFNAGTVAVGFSAGVYGGGTAAGGTDLPVEQLGLYDGGVA